jgi:23S rRNA (uracil1939-C5)-methyltransferase
MITPKCRHFGVCGGCTLQHISYEEELRFKQKKIESLFPDIAILPIIGVEDLWEGRNKMEFSFSQDKKGEKFLGLYMAKGRGKVLTLEECPVSPPWFSEMLKRVFEWWKGTGLLAYHPRSDRGTLRLLTLRDAKQGHGRQVMLTVSGNPDFAMKREELDSFTKAVYEEGVSVFLRIHQAQKGVKTHFFEMHLKGPETIEEVLTIDRPLHFALSPTSFFQPHTKQAEQLYRIAKEWASPDNKVIYDLFSGTATLAQVMADKAKEVIAIEIVPEAILDAKANIRRNGFSNIRLIEGDVFKVLVEKKDELPKADLIVLDPPRAGLGEKTAHFIADLKAKEILYISCNPESQARDVMIFMEKGYVIEKIQPLDQFPRTRHVENIVMLRYTA